MDTEEKIAHLESLLALMKREKDKEELLQFPWVGNLGTWYWNVPANIVVCNDQKIKNLGYTDDEIPATITYSFFTDKLHPDDYERVMQQMRRHLKGIDPVYESEYRIKAKDGTWRWYYDRGKVVDTNTDGSPLHLAGIVFDITRQKELEAKIEEQNAILKDLADRDPLTKLYNRRALYRIIEQQWAVHDATESYVLMLDLDHFKQVNDTHGHIVGDQVLQKVSELLVGNVRAQDIVGRFGGEEFLIYFNGIEPHELIVIAERLRSVVQQAKFPSHVLITISGGFAHCTTKDVDTCIGEADTYLYQAKRAGRNRILGLDYHG